MRRLLLVWKRLLYLLITGSTSVFIAACYGMPVGFGNLGSWTIKVENDNNEPIPGIDVVVLQYVNNSSDPDTLESATTDSVGTVSFFLTTNDNSSMHRHEAFLHDRDGQINGGAFADTILVKGDSDQSVVVLRRQQ